MRIRRIYDKAQVGILLVGMPRLIMNLKGEKRQYAQLYSRVGIATKLNPLTEEDKELIKPKFFHFNNSNKDYNYSDIFCMLSQYINENTPNFPVNQRIMTSTSTQTDMIDSEDEDENFIKNILELNLSPL